MNVGDLHSFCFTVFPIAVMMHAQEADSTNLEVVLAIGVSHTNG